MLSAIRGLMIKNRLAINFHQRAASTCVAMLMKFSTSRKAVIKRSSLSAEAN